MQPTEETAAAELAALTTALVRLSPSWTNPEQFHIAKSELIGRLRALARKLALPEPRRLPFPRPVRSGPPLPAPPGPPLRFVRANMLAPVPVQPPRQAPVMAMAMAAPVRRAPARRRRHTYPKPPTLSPSVQPRLLDFGDAC